MAASLTQEAYRRRTLVIALGSAVLFSGTEERRSAKNKKINKENE
jgi:hypothetical protein